MPEPQIAPVREYLEVQQHCESIRRRIAVVAARTREIDAYQQHFLSRHRRLRDNVDAARR